MTTRTSDPPSEEHLARVVEESRRQEAAYRRGFHHAAAEARAAVERCRTIEDALARLGHLEDRARAARESKPET